MFLIMIHSMVLAESSIHFKCYGLFYKLWYTTDHQFSFTLVKYILICSFRFASLLQWNALASNTCHNYTHMNCSCGNPHRNAVVNRSTLYYIVPVLGRCNFCKQIRINIYIIASTSCRCQLFCVCNIACIVA